MTGKIVPYVLIGLIQVTLVLTLARLLFGVPIHGSLTVLYLAVLVFIAANLTLGLTFSSLARNQLQGDADDIFLLPALDAAFGFHVSVSRHAELGPGHRRSVAADPFSARGARCPAQGQRLARGHSGNVADRALRGGGDRDRSADISQHPGLTRHTFSWRPTSEQTEPTDFRSRRRQRPAPCREVRRPFRNTTRWGPPVPRSTRCRARRGGSRAKRAAAADGRRDACRRARAAGRSSRRW